MSAIDVSTTDEDLSHSFNASMAKCARRDTASETESATFPSLQPLLRAQRLPTSPRTSTNADPPFPLGSTIRLLPSNSSSVSQPLTPTKPQSPRTKRRLAHTLQVGRRLRDHHFQHAAQAEEDHAAVEQHFEQRVAARGRREPGRGRQAVGLVVAAAGVEAHRRAGGERRVQAHPDDDPDVADDSDGDWFAVRVSGVISLRDNRDDIPLSLIPYCFPR